MLFQGEDGLAPEAAHLEPALLEVPGQVLEFDGRAGAQGHGPLHDVFQFPDVSGKLVP